MKYGQAEASKSFQRRDLIDYIVVTEWVNVNLKEKNSTLWIAK